MIVVKFNLNIIVYLNFRRLVHFVIMKMFSILNSEIITINFLQEPSVLLQKQICDNGYSAKLYFG